jgi:XapX domain-containing protein
MKVYLLSLGAGLVVGVFYALIQVRSPAPPAIALLGLLGILIGEQIPAMLRGPQQPLSAFWMHHVKPHVFGHMPKGRYPPLLGTKTAEPNRET